MSAIQQLWSSAKLGRALRCGPVTLHAKLRRTPGPRVRHVLVAEAPECAGDDAEPQQSQRGSETAVIVGAGEKLGSALALRFASAGMQVMVARRHPDALEPLIANLARTSPRACAMACDATDSRSVARLFAHVRETMGEPDVVVFNVEAFTPGKVLDITPDAFEDCWRANCLGGFIVGREAARHMLARGRGTLVFGGATASLRGRAGYINLAVGKFGLRALAQSMARELGPQGVHVAHVVLDGGMLAMGPDAVAENYYLLHRQPRTAWTHEIDLRPWEEPW